MAFTSLPGGLATRGDAGEHPIPDFAAQVGDALRHLHDVVYLQARPLAALLEPTPRRTAPSAGQALHRALLDALATLQPDPQLAADDAARRRHRLLMLRYVEGLDSQAVQARLAISARQYDREHGDGLAAVASVLHQRWAAAAARLPLALTSFVGRERDVTEITRLLAVARLLTLNGPGGVGKTRLALHVGAALAAGFEDGVCWVSLAPIRDPALVLPAVARALGVPEMPGAPLLATLAEALQHRHLLLLLDNCEHVLGAAPSVADLLAACPRLTVLATSRAALRGPSRSSVCGSTERCGYSSSGPEP